MTDITECNCILFSGVLQYLELYEQAIDNAINLAPDYIILERTPVGENDKIWKETVREPIYNATYAARVFSERNLTQLFKNNYSLVDSWESTVDGRIQDENGKQIVFKSFVFNINR